MFTKPLDLRGFCEIQNEVFLIEELGLFFVIPRINWK